MESCSLCVGESYRSPQNLEYPMDSYLEATCHLSSAITQRSNPNPDCGWICDWNRRENPTNQPPPATSAIPPTSPPPSTMDHSHRALPPHRSQSQSTHSLNLPRPCKPNPIAHPKACPTTPTRALYQTRRTQEERQT